MPGRDTSTFLNNFTASLRVCHKNIIANEQSTLMAVATALANTTHTHAILPTINYTLNTLSSQENTIRTTKLKPSQKELKKQQKIARTEAESDSTQLNQQLEALESQIKPLTMKKKEIDDVEKTNKDKKKKPYLSDNKQQERLALLQQIDELLIEKIILCQGLIEEHVMRRLDITFLLMTALYKQNVAITKGKTDRQHGRGSKTTGTAACHASLIPHPVLKPIHVASSSFYNPLKHFSIYQQFFGLEAPALNITEEKLKQCYLYDLLNLTNELPTIVNEFDGHMEGKWIKSNAVESLIQTLNLVSVGELNPIQGINRYADIMNLFFTHIEYRYFTSEPTYTSVQSPQAFSKVWQFQRRATFAMFTKQKLNDVDYTHHINQDYLHHMLKLQELPAALRLISTDTSTTIEHQILKLQQEIWLQPSKYTEKLDKSSQSKLAT